jgi:hypothetical protein
MMIFVGSSLSDLFFNYAHTRWHCLPKAATDEEKEAAISGDAEEFHQRYRFIIPELKLVPAVALAADFLKRL